MKDVYVLGIESSCDETSVSIIKNGTIEIKTVTASQIDTHKKYGGVVPEVASRMHTEAITIILENCLNDTNMKMEDMDYIAVTYAPGLMGSLLVGLEFAKTLAYVYKKPLIPVHHIKGHIFANKLFTDFEFPILCLVVSGGHTDLILMRENDKYQYLGSTLDDAIGEAYDKVARVIGLQYPGGPMVDKISYEGKKHYNLPMPLDDDSFNFSFSGIKSAVINLVHNERQRGNEINKNDLAYAFQHNCIDTIVKKTITALKKYNINILAVAGGVSANSYLREILNKECNKINVKLLIPSLNYCTDNAAMIGACGFFDKDKATTDIFKINAIPNERL